MVNDIFGGGEVEAPVVEAPEKAGEGEGAGKPEAGKTDTTGADDKGDKGGKVENNPEVKALQDKLASMGGNLSGQNKIINNLKKEIENLKGGKTGTDGAGEKGASGELFKEIKTSKDLTKEEKDEMTESEIKQFDEIATLKQGINQLAQLISSGKTQDGTGAGNEEEIFIETGDTSPVEDLKAETKTIALKLAGDDVDMANKIINEFNQFAGNDTLNKAQLLERISKSAKLVDGYKPIKEQATKRGGSVGGSGKDDKDPFGINAVVEGVKKGNDGKYSL